jgi:septal ring factor EnvC (AmiA/AmiB activator)
MTDKQKLQAIYGELKNSKIGNYTKVKKELDLLGMTASTEEIEILHSIVINTSSLKDAIELADKLSESEKLKLSNEVKADNEKKEETKRKAVERKKAEDVKKAEQKEAAEAKAEMTKTLKSIQNKGTPQIDHYKVVKGKTLNELQGNVLKYMGRGYVPLGGVAAAAFGAGIVTGNSYVQAMVKYKE